MHIMRVTKSFVHGTIEKLVFVLRWLFGDMYEIKYLTLLFVLEAVGGLRVHYVIYSNLFLGKTQNHIILDVINLKRPYGPSKYQLIKIR